MKPLLLLVDLQNDYLSSPDLEPAAGAVVQEAARLLQHCRERGVAVAHVWTTVSRDPDNRMPHWKRANLWQCEEGTPGHRPPEALAPIDGEPIIHKTGFSAFTTPFLRNLVRELEIDTVILAGTKAHACVRQVALDAMQAGLAVWVASDAVASDDPLHAAITRRYLDARGVEFAPALELAAKLAGPSPSIDEEDGKPTRSLSRSVSGVPSAARNFAQAWRETPMTMRIDLLRRLPRVLATKIDHFGALMATEIGKPVRFGRIEATRSVEMLEGIARHASDEHDATETHSAWTVRRRPHGMVAAITPWNNPIYIPLGKIVPAVVHGNTVVWKPAPEARALSRSLFECFAEAGWPEGLVTLLEGDRREAEALMSSAGIGAVTFTGSSAAGYNVQEICARRHLRLQAELGGNNAAVVWPDADLHEAARLVAAGAFAMAGQRCTANRRVIIHKACRHAFMRLLLNESAALKWGNPLKDETVIGPMVSISHRERVAGVVERALAECGSALRPLGDTEPVVREFVGRFYPPTILCCDNQAAEVVQDETFGPVLVVQTATDWDSAMSAANGVRQGLVASVFTNSPEIVHRFLDEAQAGILKINHSTADAAVDAPFGGWKASGVGPPEHGDFDVEFFTRPQTVYGEADMTGASAQRTRTPRKVSG